MISQATKPRVEVVDALRGFAIMAIMLLHNLEHFDLYYFPETLSGSIKVSDGYIWNTIFFLFAGKTYTIFALLFGFSFFIMDNNQSLKGHDFRGRFLWRMVILLGFGLINGMFFEGDILSIYAVLGCSLVFVNKLPNKAVLFIAIFLLIQPVEWIKVLYYSANPGLLPIPASSNFYFGNAFTYLSENSLWDLIIGNSTNGRTGVLLWSWENGRFFQTPALFMLGMLLGRLSLFIPSTASKSFWEKTLFISVPSLIILHFLNKYLGAMTTIAGVNASLGAIISSIYNLAFTFMMVSAFVLSYQTAFINKILKGLSIFGKMSLTNYLMQSFMGAFIYYGFALGMYKYTGATYSLLIGIGLFVIQLLFCKWWLKTHKQGPLEALWHKLTWIGRTETKKTEVNDLKMELSQ